MTIEQLKLAVRAQTLLEVFEQSNVETQLLHQAKECIDKLIEVDKKSDCITVPGLRGYEISPTEINRGYTTITNDKVIAL